MPSTWTSRGHEPERDFKATRPSLRYSQAVTSGEIIQVPNRNRGLSHL